MESFEQSYATLPQDLVGNLRPAAREIGFVRSLSLFLSFSVCLSVVLSTRLPKASSLVSSR